MARKVVDLITSLKLTIVCLAAGMALIFAGTLARIYLGIHEAQQRYFQSFFVWWPPESRGLKFPIFPGVLQVVDNSTFLAPYVACVIVAAGLLVQFGYHLVGFARRRASMA